MGAIPTQRETTSRAHGAPECARADATLTGSPLAPGSARAVVRAALAEWTGLALPGTEHLTGRAGDDAELIADRKSTRLNSSHVKNSYAVFCWKKKRSSRRSDLD